MYILILKRHFQAKAILEGMLRNRKLRDEFRDELKNMLRHLNLLEKSVYSKVGMFEARSGRFFAGLSAPIIQTRIYHSISASLKTFSVLTKSNILALRKMGVVSSNTAHVRSHYEELESIQEWAARASKWHDNQYFPRGTSEIGMRDAAPLMRPSWSRNLRH